MLYLVACRLTRSKQIVLKDVPKRIPGGKETLVMDPIHSFIDISEYPVIKQLIETKYFQRLRRLYQLGMTSTVYPNATHSRFAHSIGVMHVFLILFDSATRRSNLSKKRIERLRPVGAVAALLHDLGHGPFSHASENILNNGKFNHEAMTRDIILKTEISTILKKNKINPQLICDILNHEVSGDLRFVSQLVSSQLDADRLDYLLRDSFFTGVNYGKIDIHRIANTLKIWEEDDAENKNFKWTVVISRKGISAVEDYILGRYLMYRGVYFHKLSRCMERLLMNVFKRASKLPDSVTHLKQIIDIKKPVTPNLLLSLDDHVCYSLFHKWVNSTDKILQDLSSRIINRQILQSKQMTKEKYISLGIDKLAEIKDIFSRSKYDRNYYFIEDKIEKSAYDTYSTDEIDDEYSPITHIMMPDEDGKLREVSKASNVISTLSDDKKVKIISLFFPLDLSPKVNKVLDN